MHQLQLSIFPEGMPLINANLGVMTKDGTVTYVYGNLPVFSHAVDDLKTFHMITSQLHLNGSTKQAEILPGLRSQPNQRQTKRQAVPGKRSGRFF